MSAPAPALLVAGTTSDAGKSILVTGLCRAFARRGVAVAPFKAQNMSNNSAVTPDGGEIGRAQALQAEAAGLVPRTDFNPVLLKPGSDRRSQVIVHGKADGTIGAADYHTRRDALRVEVTAALDRLRREFDLVLCEGAGSPAEVNLRAGDIANMGLAAAANLPTLVVGDIDRGGVLAHFVGTLAALDAADQERVAGFVVNKFRGDPGLLEPGLEWVRRTTGRPVLGVLPFLAELWLDAEDGLGARPGQVVGRPAAPRGRAWLDVAAIRLPRLSNSTDVEALAMEPGIRVRWVDSPAELAGAGLVVLPGTKATLADLEWLRAQGLAAALVRAVAAGTVVVGICGGFQMLGAAIVDDVETVSGPARGTGLNVLDVEIAFGKEKRVRPFRGAATGTAGQTDVTGYEIHHGRVVRNGEAAWLCEAGGAPEGARRGRVFGTHVHGLFASDAFRREFLGTVVAPTLPGFEVAPDTVVAEQRARQLDVLADAVEEALDLEALLRLARDGAAPYPTLTLGLT